MILKAHETIKPRVYATHLSSVYLVMNYILVLHNQEIF
jgi:hypothetical protein